MTGLYQKRVGLHRSIWTAEGDAKLRELWQSGGPSATEIAFVLGTNKNAVIGRAHRMGLPMKSKPTGVRKPEPERKYHSLRVDKPRLKDKTAFVKMPSSDKAEALHLKIWELKENHCKFVYGDPQDFDTVSYCGIEITKPGGFCAFHRKLCYLPNAGAVSVKLT